MEILTPNKTKVVLKDWITGRDDEDIQRPITAVKFQIGASGAGSGEINAGEAMEKSKHIAIEKVVISIDGKTENVLDLVLDLPKKDYQFVMKEVDKVVTGDFTKPSEETVNDGIKSEK
jgi:hypothetical protein